MQDENTTQAPADATAPVVNEDLKPDAVVEGTVPQDAPDEEVQTSPDEDLQEAPDSDEVTAGDKVEEVKAEDLHATNSGVDLAASNLPGPDHEVTKDERSNLTPAEVAQKAADPTPAQEAALSTGEPGRTDGSGILTQTNQDVIDNFPKNENGQVEIDETGRIKGLGDHQQPAPGNITGPAKK